MTVPAGGEAVATFQVEIFAERGGTGFRVPATVVEQIGDGRKRVPVRVTINGHTYRSTVAVYGGEYLLVVNKTNRSAAGITAGDVVAVTLARDDEPRVVAVPDDLAAALAGDAVAAEAFERLSYTHKREYVEWIGEAKKPETRARRVANTLERVRAGRTAR